MGKVSLTGNTRTRDRIPRRGGTGAVVPIATGGTTSDDGTLVTHTFSSGGTFALNTSGLISATVTISGTGTFGPLSASDTYEIVGDVAVTVTSGTVEVTYDPAEFVALPSLVAYYDASDLSTITESSGAVSAWIDKSNNTNDLAQSTGTKKPTTGTRTLNSLNVLDFDAGDVLASTSAVSLDTVHTIVAVLVPDTAAADQIIAELSADTNNNIGGYLAILSSGRWETAVHGSATINTLHSVRNFATVPTAAGQIVARTNGGTHATHKFRRNGVDQGTGTTPVNVNDDTGTVAISTTLYVGGRGTTPVAGLNAGLAALIVLDVAASDPEIEAIEDYLASKYGITI